MSAEKARPFFENHFGEKASSWVALAASGSARANFIGENSKGKFVITANKNIRENSSFLYFSQVFSDLKLNTPRILAINETHEIYIQEYLGSRTLSEVIAEEGLSENVRNLVKQTLQKLFVLQKNTAGKIDYTQTFEYEKYDELPVTHDLYYFKNFLVDVLELEYHRSSLLKEFKTIAALVENLQPKGLMIRDFQARNIMVNDRNEVSFIDYQTAMHGPLMYDVISFLFQAKANFPEYFTTEMLDYYISFFENKEEQSELKKSIAPMKLMRFLQVLGAYGFRGIIQRKPHFLASLAKGIDNLYQLSESWDEMKNFPELQQLIVQLKSDATRKKISELTH